MNRWMEMPFRTMAIPLFLIRLLNGALLRLLPSIYIMSLYVMGKNDMLGAFRFLLLIFAVSLVWSFFYIVATPSVPLLAYLYRDYPQKIRSLLAKRTGYFAAVLLLELLLFLCVRKLPIYAVLYFLYLLCSIAVNILMTVTVSSMEYNPILEDLCYGEGSCANRSVREICHESGLAACFSWDGLKHAVHDYRAIWNGRR